MRRAPPPPAASARTRARPVGVRPVWRHAAGGSLLGLLVALLVWAPAQWLAWGVSQVSQGQVQWLNARGTVWSGSAHLVLSGGPGSQDRQALPGRLNWTLSPLWTGLRLSWQADCCMSQAAHWQFQVGVSKLQIQASDHVSQWPAALLTGLGAPWNSLQPAGQLRLRTQGLQLVWTGGHLQMSGLAELQLNNMSSRLSSTRPIGSYQLDLRAPPEGSPTPSLQLSTLQGPLLISGQGQWVAARLRFSGEASAQEGHEPALNNLLNILGRRQGSRSLLTLG